MRLHLTALRVQARAEGHAAAPVEQPPVVVWFKHDLRSTDHPGLTRAIASRRPVIAFFCFDPAILSDQRTTLWSPRVVHGAIRSLRTRLAGLNVPLVVAQGATVPNLARLVTSSGATAVHSEAEVEYRWQDAVDSARAELPSSVDIVEWCAPIWDEASYDVNYTAFRRRRGAPLALLPEPMPQLAWPELDDEFQAADMPAFESWDASLSADILGRLGGRDEARQPLDAPDGVLEAEKGLPVLVLREQLSGGEDVNVELLETYLGASSGPASARDASSDKLMAVVTQLESVPGNDSGSFTAIFQSALALGVLSRRYAYQRALVAKRERGGGRRLWPRTETPASDAAIKVAETGDFHVALARLLLERPNQATPAVRRFWRWNGQLTDFLVAEPPAGAPVKATVLLVHGFGAFAEHWRRNVPQLAEKGYRVFACTLPGFGPSEKSPQLYTTALWKSFVRDFVINVVQEPVVVAGNSIGGIIPANACADDPDLFRGLVLINTAGSADEEWDPANPPTKEAPNKLIANLLSRVSFVYLQRGIRKQLERLYPTRPYNADKFLNDEIFRASCDPCSLQVMRSGVYLAPQRPLPFLLNQLYRGPVLILQGVLDPLNKARDRADVLEKRIHGSRKVLLEAGHCPHDEVPELVNDAIDEFIISDVLNDSSRGAAGAERAAVAV